MALQHYYCIKNTILPPYSIAVSDRHVSNLRRLDVVESGPAGKIHNVLQIRVKFRLKSNNRTRRQHMYTFWQSNEYSYRSPSKAIVFQGAQSTNTSLMYNIGLLNK